MISMIQTWVINNGIFAVISKSFYETYKIRKLKALATEKKYITYSTRPINYKFWGLDDVNLLQIKHIIVSKGEYQIIEKDGKWIIERFNPLNCLRKGSENCFDEYLAHYGEPIMNPAVKPIIKPIINPIIKPAVKPIVNPVIKHKKMKKIKKFKKKPVETSIETQSILGKEDIFYRCSKYSDY